MRRAKALAVVAALVAGVPGALVALPAAAETGDVVSALDTLALDAASWSTETRTLTPLPFMTGEFAVEANGSVAFPVIGRVAVEGRTVSELSAAMTAALQDRLGIVDEIFVSLKVAEHAPFFVVGAVEAPGAFPFRPGLTAMQAIAVAGGVRRSQTIFSRTDRDAARALGDHRLLELERMKTLATIARLEAEKSGASEIPVPPELQGEPLAAAYLEVEAEVMRARQDDHAAALASIEELKSLVAKRIETMRQESATRQKVVAATRAELETMRDLVDRGLSQTSRANSAERALADAEARVLELETAVLAAEQQRNEAERDELELKGQRRVTIVSELQDQRTELGRIDVRLNTAGALFSEAARFGSTIAELNAEDRDRTVALVVTRKGEGAASRTFTAAPGTVLRSGDVLEVRAPDIDGAGAGFDPTPNLPSELSSDTALN
ncbi:succinoglycan export protein ExoF [Stappia sp. 22II-S9-Z10]|nr:succinoglycan export protein ExoF [Stappia sp. 22II-S9-Z10]